MTMDHIERRFAVSFHINHPDIDPQRVTDALGIEPQFFFRVGEQKRFPSGKTRAGTFENSGWYHRFDLKEVRDLFPFLEELLTRLELSGNFLPDLAGSGGSAELFCGIFVTSNW